MPYPSVDTVILKVFEDPQDPETALPGAWLWGGPAIWQDDVTEHLIKSPLVYLDPNEDIGALIQQAIYGTDIVRHIDTDAFDVLEAGYGTLGGP